MKRRILSVLLCLCMVMALLPTTALASSTSISNFTQLQAAFDNGGDYTLTQNITVTGQLTLASDKTLTIHGNGRTIQPAVTGLNEQGLVNGDATAIENIIQNNGTLTLNNLTIYGGKGRCIYNSGTLTMTGVSLERAHLTGNSQYGAGLYNDLSANARLTNCNIRRNGCGSAGGGFFNNDGSTLILEDCAIVENRNFGTGTGGGGGQNSGTLYMNNCTVANNQSTEVGGGLNNYLSSATAYIMNSTFTGNVTTAGAEECGGGIGNNDGTVYAVNSAFAFNYANNLASDIGIYDSFSTNVNLYYCAYGAIAKYSDDASLSISNCQDLDDDANASDLFNGAYTSGIVRQDGVEDTTTTFDRPVITQSGGTYGVYPASAESSALKSGGTKTYYDSTDFTVKMSYGSSSPGTSLVGLAAATTAVLRPDGSDTSGLIGALPTSASFTASYTVKVNPATGGTVTGGSAQGNSYPAGTTNIQITAVPNAGYTFSSWKVGTSAVINSTDNPYTIASLSNNVTLTPVFDSTPTPPASTDDDGDDDDTPPTYKVESEVSKDTDGGVSLSKSNAKKGDTVTITVTPDRYYKVDGVTVKDKNGKEIAVTDNGDGTFTFKMPASKVTVEPDFSWDNPFVDVAEDTYYAPAVEWALKSEVTNGTGAGSTFSPNVSCTRAQIVTFLWRAANCPEPTGTQKFDDVAAGAYYEKAIAWAVENGITDGTGNGLFSPDAICTRAQAVTFLFRSKGITASNSDIEFEDVAPDAYYADAVAWALEKGITNGVESNLFAPNNTCTRAQIITFLYRNRDVDDKN